MIPSKLQSGMHFKTSTVKKINQIIDYLKTQRLSGDLNTIKITQNTSGISISVIPQPTGLRGKSESFDHPFKLKILTEQDNQFLTVNDGRIQINDNFQDRVLIENVKIALDELENDGEYSVLLILNFNPSYDGGNLNPVFTPNIIFIPADSQTTNVPCTKGVFTIPLGTITKETVEEKTKFKVQSFIIGNFVIDYSGQRHPFSIYAKLKSITDGQLKNNFQLSDFSIFVDKGMVKVGETLYQTSGQTFNLSGDTKFYCQINEKEKSIEIISGNDLNFFDSENKIFNYPLGSVVNNNGIFIEQYQNSMIFHGAEDTYKVKLNENDNMPEFLSNKIQFNDSGIFGNKQYLGSQTITDENGNSYLKPYWMYKNIPGWSEVTEEQFLKNKNGSLVWGEGNSGDGTTKVDIVGSLANHVEIQKSSDEKEVRWKAEYSTSDGINHFLLQDEFGKLTLWDGGSSQSSESVLIWDHLTKKPGVKSPPEKTDSVDNWILAGNETGLSWIPSGSDTYKIKLNEQDEIPDYLLNKIQVEQPLSMEVSEGKIKIKLNIPEGDGVLAMVDGQLTLIEFGDCKKNEQ